MPHYYIDESCEADPHKLPDLLVTQFTTDELQEYFDAQTVWTGYEAEQAEACTARYMACVCFSGCMPDSDWSGPYETIEEAVTSMREMYGLD